MEMTMAEKRHRIMDLIAMFAPAGTKFDWDGASRRFGRCSYSKNRITGKYHDFKITISYELARRNSWEVIKGVVLHEIAHANTPGHGHDSIWRRECIRLGGDGERCYLNEKMGGPVKMVPPKFIGTCPVCGLQFGRNRRSQGAYHTGCGNRFNPIIWTENREERVV